MAKLYKINNSLPATLVCHAYQFCAILFGASFYFEFNWLKIEMQTNDLSSNLISVEYKKGDD